MSAVRFGNIRCSRLNLLSVLLDVLDIQGTICQLFVFEIIRDRHKNRDFRDHKRSGSRDFKRSNDRNGGNKGRSSRDNFARTNGDGSRFFINIGKMDRLNQTSNSTVASADANNNNANVDNTETAPGSNSENGRQRVGRRGSNSKSASGTGENSATDGLTEVAIDGHIFRLDLSDPAMSQWMEYYMEFLNYRRRFQGQKRRR